MQFPMACNPWMLRKFRKHRWLNIRIGIVKTTIDLLSALYRVSDDTFSQPMHIEFEQKINFHRD